MGGKITPQDISDKELENYYIQSMTKVKTLKAFRDYVEFCFDFDRDFNELKILIQNKFVEWLNDRIYLVFGDTNENILTFSQASKRGNRAYVKRSLKRLNPVKDALRKLDKSFFVNKSGRILKTKSLFMTLTIDPQKLLWNRELFWKTITKHYDNFVRAIISKYGKAFVMKGVIEATQNGYPHIHLIMIFEDRKFNCFRHYNRKREKTTYRIHEKGALEHYWKLGFIDVQAIKNRYQASAYCLKYGAKGYDREAYSGEQRDKIELTLSLNWYFKKHSFTFRYLNLLLTYLILVKQNSHNGTQSINVLIPQNKVFLGLVSIKGVIGSEKLPPSYFVVSLNSIFAEETLNQLERAIYG